MKANNACHTFYKTHLNRLCNESLRSLHHLIDRAPRDNLTLAKRCNSCCSRLHHVTLYHNAVSAHLSHDSCCWQGRCQYLALTGGRASISTHDAVLRTIKSELKKLAAVKRSLQTGDVTSAEIFT